MAGDAAQSPISNKGRRALKLVALVLVAAIAAVVTALIWQPHADQPEKTQSVKSADPPGTFRPTQLQWRSLKLAPVMMMAFRPEQVTEGTIAVDDDLTTPVFSHYSGRVTKVIAMLGDVVEPGAPLFVIHASELVQAQNDLITALANLQSSRSQLKMAQTTEKRTHELYLAQGGALKDWQQAQTDLITAQNTVRANEIAFRGAKPVAHPRQKRSGDRLARRATGAEARSGDDRDRAGSRHDHPAPDRGRPIHQQ
jgi:membrane fusion protein, heavy metal efflux system